MSAKSRSKTRQSSGNGHTHTAEPEGVQLFERRTEILFQAPAPADSKQIEQVCKQFQSVLSHTLPSEMRATILEVFAEMRFDQQTQIVAELQSELPTHSMPPESLPQSWWLGYNGRSIEQIVTIAYLLEIALPSISKRMEFWKYQLGETLQ